MSLREIATLTAAQPGAGVNLDQTINGIAPLNLATPRDLTFFDNIKYLDHATVTTAGACVTLARLAEKLPARVSVLIAPEPYRTFVDVARALFPESLRPSSLFETSGVAPGASLHETARLESGVTIDPGAVIGPRAEIGSGTVIGPGAVIGPNVRIGRDCSIGANVTIVHALVGDRVIIHPGCAVGQDGFGFARTPKGVRKIPQVGRVIIQDDVEIGANTTIDRGAIRDTVIGEGSKIDNLVQIAHNVMIGRHCLLAGQVGLSGTTTLEDGVVIGGQAGVAEHITIGAGAQVAAKSGLMLNVPPGERWGGSPARPGKQWLRQVATLERLAKSPKGRRADESEIPDE
jgi:UDP-3-O-[3-hydroxymyristoyl] glucosamine N-acyltransferase